MSCSQYYVCKLDSFFFVGLKYIPLYPLWLYVIPNSFSKKELPSNLNDVTKTTSDELGKSHNQLCNNNDGHKSV